MSCLSNIVGQQVKVYKNLNNGKISIKMKVDGKEKVVGYADKVTLKNVTFKVQEGGRQRVIKERQKNVHAFVCGELVAIDGLKLELGSIFTYNPYNNAQFVDRNNGREILKASLAQVDCEGRHTYKV